MTTTNASTGALPRVRALTLAVWAAWPALASANPVGPEVVSGQASFHQAGSTLTVTNSPGAILHWQSFSIAEGELTRFVQQSAASSVLNRIVGHDPSLILGSLQSNGQVFLINPNGIVFGPNAQVDVAGLVASSLNVSNPDFLAGRLSFSAELEAGAIRNDGAIRTLGSGNIYLIAPSVENHGIIQAPDGAVVLAAGSRATLVDTHRPDVRVEIAAPEHQALNVGSLIGGHIGIYGGAVRQEGVVSATQALVGDGGTVVFKAATSVRLGAASKTLASGDAGGTIHIDGSGSTIIDGEVKATGSTGTGGRVTAVADRIELSSGAAVDASGRLGGGTVLIGGGLQGNDPAVRNAQSTSIAGGATISADALLTGTGGDVIVWADGRTDFAGTISARGGAAGGDGGFAEVSGRRELVFQGSADLRAPAGRTGELLLDPGAVVINTTAGATGDGVNTFSAATLSGQLAQTNVTIRTSDATNGQPESITISGTGTLSWASANTLSLVSGGAININAPVTMSGGGTLAFSAPTPTTIGAVTITGGRLQDDGTAGLVITNSNTILSGVTLDARLAVPANNSFRIRNGLTLDGGSVFLTNGSILYYDGNQSITATAAGGEILFASPAGSANNSNSISPWSGFTLSIGAGVTIRSDTTTPGGGTVNLNNVAGTTATFAGTVLASGGRTITVTSSNGNWESTGRIEAAGGIVNLNSAASARWGSSGTGRLVLGDGGTFNLDGTFLTTSFETLQRSNGAGTLNLTGTIDNTGDVLTLNAATGSLNATGQGSTVLGGRIEGEAGRLVMSGNAALDGVTLATRVSVPASQSMRIRNGLTLDGGSVFLTNTSTLYYEGNQSITGTATGGSILFASPAGSPNNNSSIAPWSGFTLSIGSGVTIRPDATTPGGGTVNLNNVAGTTATFAGTVLASGGRTINVTSSNGNWENTGRIEAAGGIVTLNSAFNHRWGSSGTGRLVLGDGGTLNLDGTFVTSSFETLQRSNGAGTLNLIGTLDNTDDVLTLNAATGTLNATGQGSIILGGRIEGEPGRLVMSATAILDAVTLATRVTVPASQSMRIRNGLTLDGGSVFLTNTSTLHYDGNQSITATAVGGQILFASPAGSANNNSNIAPWSSHTLSIGAGVTIRPDATTPGGGTVNLNNVANTTAAFAGTVLASSGRTITVTSSNGNWENTGRIEAAGGIVTLNSAFNHRWSSTGTGRLVLGDVGTLNLDGTFVTSSFETLQRSNGAGTLNLIGTLDNTGDVLTLNATTGTLNATAQGSIILRGRIEGEPGRLVMSGSSILDGVTLATRVTVPTSNSFRIRNGLTLDGGSVLLTNNSTLHYDGNQSITATAAGGQILFASPGSSAINSNNIAPWSSHTLSIGAGVTIRPDATTPGGGTVNLNNIADTTATFAGTVLATSGRTITVTSSNGNWENTGRIEAAGGIVTLNSAFNNRWGSTRTGRLVLEDGGTLNLDGTFVTTSFETLQRSNGAGTLNLIGTLDNTADVLTLDATTGTLNANTSQTVIRGGRIAGDPGRLVLSGSASLDAVTLATRVNVPTSSSFRIRNGLTLDGGSVFLTNNSSLFYEGNQSITATATGGQILFASPGSSANNNNNNIAPWSSHTLSIGAGVTIRPDATTPGGGTISLSNTAAADGTNAGTILANLGRTIVVTSTGNPWTNSGTLGADNGTLTLTNLGASTGPLQVDNGGTLNLSGTIQAAALNSLAPSGGGTTINISGTVLNANSTLNFNAAKGVINLVSGGRIVGGTVIIDGNFLNVADGRFQDVTLGSDLTIRGGQSLRVAGALTLDDATVTLAGDSNGTASVYADAAAPWQIAGTGGIVFAGTTGRNELGTGGAPLTLDNGIIVTSPRGGTVNFGAGGVNNARIDIASTNAAFITNLTGNNWINRGTITATTGDVNVNELVSNEATFRVAGATVDFNVGDGAAHVWTNGELLQLDSGRLTLGGTLTTATLNSIDRPNDADRGTLRIAARIDNANSTLALDAQRGPVFFTSQSGFGTVAGGIVESSPDHFLFDYATLENTTLRGTVNVRGSELRVNGTLTLDNALITMDASAGGTGYIWNNLDSAPWSVIGTGEIRFAGTSANNWIGWYHAPLTLGPGILVTGTQGGTMEFGSGGVNQATVRVTPTNPAAVLRVGGNNWDNRGRFEFTTATATVDGLPANNGTIIVDGAVVNLAGGNGNTFAWTNPGTLRLDRGTLTLDGRITPATLNSLARPNDADRGTLNFAGALDNSGATTTFDAARGLVTLISDSTILGGTVVVADDALAVTRGTLDNVTLRGALNLRGQAELSVIGALTLDNAVLTLDSTGGTNTVQNATSNVPWSVGGSGRIVFSGTTRANNLGSTTAPMTLGSGVRVEGTQAGTIYFGTGGVNQGTIAVTPASGTALVQITGTDWRNEGSIVVSTGIADITGLLSNPGSVSVTGGALSYNVQSGQTYAWTNAGAITLDSGTLTLGGLLTPAVFNSIQRPVDADRGTLRLAGVLDNANTTTVFDAARGTVQIVSSSGRGSIRNGTIRVSDGSLRFINGNLTDVSLEGELVLVRGDDATVTGAFTLVNDAALVFDGASPGTGGSTFFYNPQNTAWSVAGTGTVRFLGSSSFNNLGSGSAALTLGPNVLVRNDPGGGARIAMGTGGVVRGTVLADGQRLDMSGTNWTNEGTLRAVNNGGTIGVSGLSANSGLIDLGANATLTTNNADLLNTGTIRGAGTIDLTTDSVNVETLINRGTLRVGDAPGFLTIDGNLRLEAGSAVVMNVADRTQGRGIGYDSITVTGALTPGGTVQISHLGGFTPGASELFLLFSPGSLSGTLSNMTLSGASAGYALTPAGSQVFVTRGNVGTINVWNRDVPADWSVGANWGLGRVPQAGDLVFIDRGAANPTVNITSGTQTAGSLISFERIAMSGGTLNVTDASELRAPLAWTGGTLAGSGTLTLLADSTWSRGTLNGSLRVGQGATLTGDGTGDGNNGTARALGTGSLIVDGTLAMVSGQTDIVGTGSIINNGLIEFRGPMNIGDRWTGTGTFTFINNGSGVIRSVNNAGVQIGSLGVPGGTPNYANFTNDGLIDVQSGTTRFNIGFSGASGGGSFTNRGTIQVASGATVDFGGPATFAAGSTITGGGNLSTSLGANVQLAGTFGLTGTVLVPTGALTFATPTPASVSTLQVTGGTVNTTTNVTVDTLTMSGGQLGGTRQMTIGSGGTWSGGTLAGRMRVSESATLGITGTATKALSGATVDNDGQINLDGVTVDVAAASTLNNTGTVDFRSASTVGDASGGTGSLTFDNTGTLRHTSTGASTLGSLTGAGGTANYVLLTNRAGGHVDTVAGTLRINAAPAGAVPGGSFTNEGTIDVGSGTTLQVGGTFTTAGGSTLQVADAGTFRKTGGFTNAAGALITGRGGIDVGAGNALVNAGRLMDGSGANRLTLTGDLTLTDTSLVSVGIGGPVAGSDFDRIDVSGTTTLAGNLTVALLGGFTPTDGDRFPFIGTAATASSFAPAGVTLPAHFRVITPGPTVGVEFAAFTCSADICWDGGANSRLWTDAANWTGDRLPQSGDIVLVDSGGTTPVVLSSGSHSIGGITMRDALTLSGGSLTITGGSLFSAPVTLAGGSLSLQGDATVEALLAVQSGTLSSGAAFTATAPVSVTGGSATFNGTTRTGGFSQTGGTTTFNGITTLDSFAQSGGASAFNGATTLGALTLEGGESVTLSGTGDVRVTGAFDWRNESDLRGTGTLTTEGVSTVTGSGGAGFGLVKAWVNRGTVNLENGARFHLATEASKGAITNASGAVFRLGTGATPFIVFNGSQYVFANAGTLVKDSINTQSLPTGLTIENTGTVRLTNGLLFAGTALPRNAGTLEIASPASVTFGGDHVNDGTIRGSGTLNVGLGTGRLTNNGAILVRGTQGPGALGLAGNFIQTATGVLDIEVPSGTTGQQGVLAIGGDGAATLDGTLRITPAGGYVPADGQVLRPLLTYVSRTGGFSRIELPQGTTLTASADYGPTVLSVSILTSTCAADVCWIAGSGDWGIASNWSTGAVPNATQSVRVSVVGDRIITVSGGTQSAGSIVMDEALRVAAGSITIGGTANFTAPVTVDGGTLVAQGPTTFSALALSSGAVQVADARVNGLLSYTGGDLTIASGGILTLGSAGSASAVNRTIGGGGTLRNEGTLTLNGTTLNGSLVNRGTTTVTGGTTTVGGTGSRIAQEGGTLTIENGATLAKDGGELAWDGGTLDGTGAIERRNGATLALGAGDKVLDGLSLTLDDLTLQGRLNLASGALTVAGDTHLLSGSTLELSGGTFAPGGALDNDGTLALRTGSLDLENEGAHTGTFDLSGGTVLSLTGSRHEFNTGSRVIGDGLLHIRGGEMDVTGDVTASNVQLSLNGSLLGSGALTVQDRFTWTGGSQYGTGRTIVADTGALVIEGADPKSFEGPRQLVNNSTSGSSWTGTGDVDAPTSSNSLSTFVNNGLLAIDTGAPWRDGFIVNNGTIVKNGTSAAQVFNAESGGLSNAGLITVNSGTLVLRGTGTHSGTFTTSNSGQVTFQPGTKFIGGTHTFGNGTSFSGSGRIVVGGDGVVLGDGGEGTTVDANTTLDLSGQSVTGTGLLENRGTLILAESVLGGRLINSGLVRVLDNSTHNGAHVDMNGGRIEVAAGAEVVKDGGTFVWNDGTLAGPGSYDLLGGATFTTGGSGARVIDGAPIRLPSLNVDAGSLELRSGGLTVGTGGTRFGSGSTFIVNNGTARLLGTADIANLRVNGGIFDAPDSLAVGSLVLTGGEVRGGGSLTIREALSTPTPDGIFARNWQSIDITQGTGDLTLNRSLDTSGSFVARVNNGTLRVVNAVVQADTVNVTAGALAITGGTQAAGLIGNTSAQANVGSAMSLQGGTVTGATAEFGARAGECGIEAASLALNDGTTTNTAARIIGSPTIGTAARPLLVPADRVTVNGVQATANGDSGFFVYDPASGSTPYRLATIGDATLFLVGAGNNPPPPPPPPPAAQPPGAVVQETAAKASEAPLVAQQAAQQTASTLAARPISFVKQVQTDDELVATTFRNNGGGACQ